jgi:hypothetical protein
VVSSEPRQKNIDKGIAARKFLRINSRIEIKQENLEEIQEAYDIVVCIGVLHHVDSVSRVMAKLSSISHVALFIETQIYEPPYFLGRNFIGRVLLNRHNNRIIEPKDVVNINNKNVSPKTSLSGHKFESSYFDGSTSLSQVVELPSIEGLKLNLYANNFSRVKQHTTTKEYGKKLQNKNFRIYRATILSAMRNKRDDLIDQTEVNRSIYVYEQSHFVNILGVKTLRRLQIRNNLCFDQNLVLRFLNFIKRIAIKPGAYIFLEKFICKVFLIRREELSILGILKFDFINKLNFEAAKFEISQGNFHGAEILLEEVISSENADWRSTYRSFFLLYLLAKRNASESDMSRYSKLLLQANASFPFDLETDVKKVFGL